MAWDDPRVVPLALDVTSLDSITEVAAVATDVTVVVNNAGATNGATVMGDSPALRDLFEVNFFGPLAIGEGNNDSEGAGDDDILVGIVHFHGGCRRNRVSARHVLGKARRESTRAS